MLGNVVERAERISLFSAKYAKVRVTPEFTSPLHFAVVGVDLAGSMYVYLPLHAFSELL